MLNKFLKIMNKSTSPKGGKRGCLCKDGKYSVDCCQGETSQQGIGSTVQQGSATIAVVDGVRTIVRSNG
jgi:hypothetical protein